MWERAELWLRLVMLLRQGDYVHAAENYQQVLTLAEKGGLSKALLPLSAKMGNLHYAQGNFAEAMEYYLKSIRLYEELGSKLEIPIRSPTLGTLTSPGQL